MGCFKKCLIILREERNEEVMIKEKWDKNETNNKWWTQNTSMKEHGLSVEEGLTRMEAESMQMGGQTLHDGSESRAGRGSLQELPEAKAGAV